MIILWASWCSPYIAEIPDFTKIYEKNKNNAKFFMTSVSLDSENGNWEKL